MNFWDNDHPLAADSTRLFDELVPRMGNCNTMQGELLRAAAKITYDWYNNGWGCNNWSGAVVFLENFAETLADKRSPEELTMFKRALAVARDYSHGERVHISDETAASVVTTIQAFVVQNILDNPAPIANTRDMLDFTEPDLRRGDYGYDDEEDEDDYED